VLVSVSSRSAQSLLAAEECALKPKDVFRECDKCWLQLLWQSQIRNPFMLAFDAVSCFAISCLIFAICFLFNTSVHLGTDGGLK
jgi:hypothetical protein